MYGQARRVELRSTFDSAAELYDRARPRYPAALFDAVVHHCGLHPGDHVVEIGSGTGIATRPMVDRGLMVTCIELGGALVAVAEARFASTNNVHIVHADFETWQPADAARFDGVALDRPLRRLPQTRRPAPPGWPPRRVGGEPCLSLRRATTSS